MFSEQQLIPISALQHWIFCPRQCGLIHIEQAWSENRLTAEGRLLHERVHSAQSENRSDVRITRGLWLVSYEYGLTGQADVVEFHRSEQGIWLPETECFWQPFPIEYKRGKPKKDGSDEVQLCAQAICLEEMLHVPVSCGAFFYDAPHRRYDVVFDQQLRQATVQTIRAVRQMLETQKTPIVPYHKKCNNCSLYQLCMPKITGISKKVCKYLEKSYQMPLWEDCS